MTDEQLTDVADASMAQFERFNRSIAAAVLFRQRPIVSLHQLLKLWRVWLHKLSGSLTLILARNYDTLA